MANSLEGLSPCIPLYRVTEGNEPCFFTTYFSWDPIKTIVQGNSFQKKVMLLFGVSHAESANRNGSSQDGPTQRASALAALTSAFNPAGDKSTSPKRSNESNQGGPTQRASALAALQSSLSPTSERKTSMGISRAASQGSQRAAALAALSTALTAEKSPRSPAVSPARFSRSPPANTSPPAPKETESPLGKESVDSQESSEVQETKSEESISKDEAEPEEAAPETPQGTFTYEQLRSKSENPVTGIDFKRREAYLCAEEFQSIFGMTKEVFYKLPRWKQDITKKKLDLF